MTAVANRVDEYCDLVVVFQRQRERGMRGPASRRFKSMGQAQRFPGAHAAVSNLFNLGRHLVRALILLRTKIPQDEDA